MASNQSDVNICDICKKNFKSRAILLKHIRNIHDNNIKYDCMQCGRSYATKHGLHYHQSTSCTGKRKQPNENVRAIRRRYESNCSICRRSFLGFLQLRQHLASDHGMESIEVLRMHLPNEIQENQGAMECVEDNVHLIMRPNVNGQLLSQHNFFNFGHLSAENIDNQITEIVSTLDNAAKINFAIGFIMQDISSGKYYYFYAEKNNYILDEQFLLSKPGDVLDLKKLISQLDVIELMCKDRPNSKYRLVHITNIMYDVHSLDYRFGDNTTELPDYLIAKKSITSLTKSANGTDIYRDKLCAFRALSCHQLSRSNNIETRTKENFARWSVKFGTSLRAFTGISMRELPLLEELFQLNILAYSLEENNVAKLVYASTCTYTETVHINVFEDHISYINNFPAYARKFECITCSELFNTSPLLVRHRRTCEKSTSVYPGGYYYGKRNIYDELEEYGICVPKAQRYYQYY